MLFPVVQWVKVTVFGFRINVKLTVTQEDVVGAVQRIFPRLPVAFIVSEVSAFITRLRAEQERLAAGE